jgi:hypothetical protein
MTSDAHDDALQLGRLWDEILSGKQPEDADTDFLSAIQRFEEIGKVPPPRPDLAAQMWEQLTGASLPLVPHVAVTPGMNGHCHVKVAAVPASQSRWRELLLVVFRAIAIGAMAGFAGGFVSGLWMRVAMRLAGFLTTGANRGLLTQNDAAVGEITLAGTLSIAMFGALVGILGGLGYVALRRWIPGSGWIRPLVFGGFMLATLGFLVMDQNNPDYRLFGPPWVNVGMCSLTYIIFGVVTGGLVDWLDRRVPYLATTGHSRRRTILTGIALAPFALIGSLAIFSAVVGVLGETGLFGLLTLLISGLAILLYKRVRMVRTFPAVMALVQRPALVGYAAFAVPSLVGVFLTLRAVTAIVGG